MKYLLLFSVIAPIILFPGQISISILPLIVNTDVSSSWEISDYVERLLRKQIRKQHALKITRNKVQYKTKGTPNRNPYIFLYKDFRTDFNIQIVLNRLKYKSVGATSYGIGGTRTFIANIETTLYIYSPTTREKFSKSIVTKKSTTGYGIFLDSAHNKGKRYSNYIRQLWSVHHNSNLFQKSFLNKVLILQINKIAIEIFRYLVQKPLGLSAPLLNVSENILYIRKGFEAGFDTGIEFKIYSPFDTCLGYGKIKRSFRKKSVGIIENSISRVTEKCIVRVE